MGITVMSDLEELQLRFSEFLLQGQGITDNVIGDDNADALERMELYAGAYRARLVEVLGNDFSGLWEMLGDEQFWSLCLAYIQQYPSVYSSIRWFGSNMVSFLQHTEPYSNYPQMSEMAAFEWAQGLVFDAPDAAAVCAEQLMAIAAQDWPQLHFEFNPAIQRLDLQWNIPQLWSALQDKSRKVPELHENTYPQGWLLWRQQLNPRWRSLDVDEAWAIDQARQGRGFAEICTGLLEWVDAEHAPTRAAGFLRTWVECDLITHIEC